MLIETQYVIRETLQLQSASLGGVVNYRVSAGEIMTYWQRPLRIREFDVIPIDEPENKDNSGHSHLSSNTISLPKAESLFPDRTCREPTASLQPRGAAASEAAVQQKPVHEHGLSGCLCIPWRKHSSAGEIFDGPSTHSLVSLYTVSEFYECPQSSRDELIGITVQAKLHK